MNQQHIPPGTIRGGPIGQNPPNEKVRRAAPAARGARMQLILSGMMLGAGIVLILVNFVGPGVIIGAVGLAWLLTDMTLSSPGRLGKAVRNFSRDAVGDESGAASRKL